MRRAISIKGVLVALLFCLASVSGRATTWVPTEVRDPITDARVKVQEPASSGSYIYQWPGKEDQVFWPYTDPAWLWFNPASGYIAFGGDFTELDATRRAALKDWLQSHYDRHAPPRSRIELLSWAEKVIRSGGWTRISGAISSA